MEFIIENALKNLKKVDENEIQVYQAKIKIVGTGGAGNNMMSWLYDKGVKGAEIIAMNTDLQHLSITHADKKLLLGKDLTRGLGAGGYPEVGEQAARESSNDIKSLLKGADMVFICAGMGGGTGTGSAPVIAEIAKDQGAIVIGVVTMPFKMEGARMDKAEWGLKKLRQVSDTVIVIDNNRLVEIAGNLPLKEAFAVANELIATMLKGIVETIALPSLVNLDFADVKAIMRGGGVSVIGVGESSSEKRWEEAVRKALMNPLLEVDYKGATGALIHITGGEDLKLEEVSKIGEIVSQFLSQDAQVIWGARVLPEMNGRIRVMTIITGVTSPYILGPVKETKEIMERFDKELGIKLL